MKVNTIKVNATLTHHRYSKADKKAIKRERKNRQVRRQVKRGTYA